MSLRTMSKSSPLVDHVERLDAVTGKVKTEFAAADLPAKPLLDQNFEIGLVIDHEDCRGHPCPPLPALALASSARGKVRINSVNVAGFGFDIKAPAMLFYDDVVAQRQAEAGPLARRFCRKKWIEDLGSHRFRNAGAVIVYPDFDPVPERPGW